MISKGTKATTKKVILASVAPCTTAAIPEPGCLAGGLETFARCREASEIPTWIARISRTMIVTATMPIRINVEITSSRIEYLTSNRRRLLPCHQTTVRCHHLLRLLRRRAPHAVTRALPRNQMRVLCFQGCPRDKRLLRPEPTRAQPLLLRPREAFLRRP